MSEGLWWDVSWNPIVGCTKCSVGCQNCWAEKMAFRLRRMSESWGINHIGIKSVYEKVVGDNGKWTGKVELCEHRLRKEYLPFKKKPKRVFVDDMSDMFHESFLHNFTFTGRIFNIIEKYPQHTFLVLTKRPHIALTYFKANDWRQNLPNVHLGVSISTQAEADEKIPILLQIPAAVRWLNIEPMIEGINIDEYLDGLWFWNRKYLARADKGIPNGNSVKLDWVVLGCESGPKRRPCKLEWMIDVVEQCKAANIPVWVKQVSINGKVEHDINKFPPKLRYQELPNDQR